MASKLESVVPWGRNIDEYKTMFKLTDADKNLRFLCMGYIEGEYPKSKPREDGRILFADESSGYQINPDAASLYSAAGRWP